MYGETEAELDKFLEVPIKRGGDGEKVDDGMQYWGCEKFDSPDAL